jgi:hypothetical protein
LHKGIFYSAQGNRIPCEINQESDFFTSGCWREWKNYNTRNNLKIWSIWCRFAKTPNPVGTSVDTEVKPQGGDSPNRSLQELLFTGKKGYKNMQENMVPLR